MRHQPSNAQKWEAGSNQHFRGATYLSKLVTSDDQGPNTTAVWFTPGAATYWHSHPEGQTLWVVAGVAVGGTESGQRIEAQAGDVIYTPPGERHWHGASRSGPMVHLSITSGGSPEWESEPPPEDVEA